MFSRRILQSLISTSLTVASTLCLVALPVSAFASDPPDLHRGYYTDPALHGDTILFTSEGDLWSVGILGGAAHRLTSAAGTENKAIISRMGSWLPSAPTMKGRPRYTRFRLMADCRSGGPGTVAPSRLDGRLMAA